MLSSFFVFMFVCTVDMVHCGYPRLVRASLMCSLSFRLSSFSVTSVSHLSSNVRITAIFWCNEWCEEKFGYWSVCVFFLKISSFTFTNSFLTSKVSKKGIVPSACFSCVKLVLGIGALVKRDTSWDVKMSSSCRVNDFSSTARCLEFLTWCCVSPTVGPRRYARLRDTL